MSCYEFSDDNLEALKKGERLFVPGVAPEKYDCWEIEYIRAPLVTEYARFGLDDSTKNLAVRILAIKDETNEEAANRFRIWCERTYDSLRVRSPIATILNIKYVKAEKIEDDV